MGVAYSVGEVDHLYTFFVQWSPDVCHKSNKKQWKPHYVIKDKNQNHILVVEKDIAAINKLLSKPVNTSAKNWEIITEKESKRRQSLCSSEDSESEESRYHDVLPELSDHSHLLDDHHLEKLSAHMPARTHGYPWQLVYSTAIHGSSLKTLYRNMADLDSPVLLVVKDMHKKVFGAFSSDPFRVSKYCYGTGETFLFSFNPDFHVYKWSGENSYFVSGNWESLQLGGGGNGFALWLDADLYRGSSFSSPTFHNASLSTNEDFIVQDLEWSPDICHNSNKKEWKPHYIIIDKNQNHTLVVKNWENWKIITEKESKRRQSLCSSEDSEAEESRYHDVLPELSDHSHLLDDHHLEKLSAHMPARTYGYPWQLVYSTAIHGSSLKTLYRNMADLDSPVLLVVKDMHKKVFGAFSSDPFRVSKYCYGTGETFLFSFNPDFHVYKWSGENSYFVSGNWESLQLGGGGSGFALWLDADLYRGSSFSSPTFHNASLSTNEDFIVQDLEVWTVQNCEHLTS